MFISESKKWKFQKINIATLKTEENLKIINIKKLNQNKVRISVVVDKETLNNPQIWSKIKHNGNPSIEYMEFEDNRKMYGNLRYLLYKYKDIISINIFYNHTIAGMGILIPIE